MKALICGIAGQDGSYLAQLLLRKGYEVVGTSRDASMTSFANLDHLGIKQDVNTTSMAINDFRSVLNVVQCHSPDEIYNLAGQTSVGLSFEQPVEAMESIAGGTLNMLEVIRMVGKSIRFYNAGSSECFGDTNDEPANELTPFNPRSPYAVAKASAHWLLRNYREAYGLFACTGILFNHESPLRPTRFVTQKIVTAAANIAKGSNEKLRLGNIEIQRDWGWAPDYVDAMSRMLERTEPADYVIATGRPVSLEYFTFKVIERFGMDWRDKVEIDDSLLRPTDIRVGRADPSRARAELGWRHTVDVDEVIVRMCEAAWHRGS